MSTVIATLKSVDGHEMDDIDVHLEDDGTMVLCGTDYLTLDRRQRQELARVLEEWPPK